MLKRITLKTTACLVIIIMLSSISMPIWANSIMEQTDATTEDNVKFDAKINGQYQITADIDSSPLLNLDISVLNGGYLKDISITGNESNYTFVNDKNEYVKAMEDNKIQLNQINANKNVNIPIHIKALKTDKVNVEMFSKQSKLTLNATYINEKGKEKKIEKDLSLKINWSADPKIDMEQNLVRCLKIDSDKTLLSLEISDKIRDNKIPYIKKEMTINIPKINNIFPEKAIVVNNKAEYKYSEGKLTILKENSTDEEGMIYWNSEDNYIVTLVYNTKLPTQEIEMPINLKVICPNNATIIQDSITKRYSTDKEIGQLVEAEINGPQEISKGFMYNNLNQVQNKLDTEYEIKYKIKVGYTELLDGIKLTEANADNFTINKKIEINHDELNRILGENGKITVYDEKGIEIGNLTNKQTEINVDVSNIHVETSKPILEGEINLIVTKKINNDIFKEKTQISSLEKVKNMVKISGIYNEKQVSDTVLLTEIKMLEPTSKSTIETNQNYLSTIVENKNVIININLETNSGEDALYENPEFEITLPNQVEKIQITDARIFYEDELKQDEFTINKNRINLKFKGKQSKYISSEISKGAIIRIVTNISLDTLETSDNSEIKLQYKNNATGETKSVSSKISIIAPNEIITTNTIDDVSAQTKDEVKKIDVYENEKQMTVGGEIINNLKKGIDKLVIIGRTPYSGNKNINGDNLNSTFTCNLLSKINIEGFDADVY